MSGFQQLICSGFLFLWVVGPSLAMTRYVDVSNAAPVAPYTSWADAGTDLQTVIDVSVSEDEILVAAQPGVGDLWEQ